MISKLVVLLLLPVWIVAASDYCSLEVKVVSDDGKKLITGIQVYEAGGSVREAISEGGIATFCDLGIKPVTVKVGASGCNRVVVEDVQLDWGNTTRLKIVYKHEPCYKTVAAAPGCRALLRVRNDQAWIQGAKILNELDRKRVLDRTDKYGRTMLYLSPNSRQEIVVSAGAAGDVRTTLNCVPGATEIERVLVVR